MVVAVRLGNSSSHSRSSNSCPTFVEARMPADVLADVVARSPSLTTAAALFIFH